LIINSEQHINIKPCFNGRVIGSQGYISVISMGERVKILSVLIVIKEAYFILKVRYSKNMSIIPRNNFAIL